LENEQLHSIVRNEIKPGVSLTCINTDKFKSGCITINFLCKLDRETAASNALLPRVLRRGSVNYPDMESLSAALDDLYGVRIEPVVRKKGEVHCIGLYIDFPDDRYIPEDGSVLESAVDAAAGILLCPVLRDGLFFDEYIESEKSNLIDDIRAAINDKRGYSIDRLLEEMCRNETFGISRLGCEEQALTITAESLTSHYNDIIQNSPVEIFYCGSAVSARVLTAFRTALEALPPRECNNIPKTGIIFHPAAGEPRRFFESLDITQGKLAVGFRLGEIMKKPDYPALMMLNALYGGCVSSKLFMNVRERLSLCYYANSMLDKHKGIMVVASGVEVSMFDTALDEILAQLDCIKRGEISDWEFTAAKRTVVTSIKSALDRPGGLEELYFDSVISAVSYDPVILADMIEAVTRERVVSSASGMQTDSIYFLSGTKDGEVCDDT